MSNLDRFKAKEIKIDDMDFIIQPFHAREAYKLKYILLEIFGPAIGTFVKSIKKIDEQNPMNSEIDMEKIGIALSVLFQKLNEEDADNLTVRLLKTTEAIGNIDGSKQKILLDNWDNIDKLFRKRLFKIYILIWEILKENYGDFFLMMSSFGKETKITDS